MELAPNEALEAAETWFTTALTDVGKYIIANPALAIFICLGLGYLLGKVKIKSFTVGATVGTLLVGLLLSLALSAIPSDSMQISSLIKTIFFSLFIFTIGYEVGPSFFNSLKNSGIKIVILSVVFAAVAFGVCYGLFKAFSVSPGEAGGIVAGALTQSAVLGTAGETIKTIMTGDAATQAAAELPIAYALTYVFGTAGLVLFMKNLAPKLLGVDIKEATKKKIEETKFQEASEAAAISALKARAFAVNPDSALVGKTVADVEALEKGKLSVEGVFRGDKPLEYAPDTVIAAGDVITLMGYTDAMVTAQQSGLTETADGKYLAMSFTNGEIILTKHYNSEMLKDFEANGIIITDAKRGTAKVDDLSTLQKNDVISVTGPKSAVAKVAKEMGYVKDTGSESDVSFLSIGIVVGLLIGAICLTVSGIPITLGAGGGALVAGLIFGQYQSKHQNRGAIPAATRWFLKSVGLNLFIAVVGLMAGGSFLKALQSMGWEVLVIGALVTLLPHIITLYFGRFVLKLDAVDIIGGQCGAGTCTAALNGVVEETGSSIFALSYTPGYAVGNILITVLGPLLVSVLV